ncbi:MAG TPA: BadF/BadG/BcrA/BcrD ATPase family protein [Actinomycetes bacterium]
MAHWAVLGLDAGGSKTKGLRVEDGRIVREGLTGSANVGYVGAEAAMHQVDLLLDRLDRERVAAACLGAAGADTPKARERWQQLLQSRLPGARIRVVHDSRLILAAAGLDQGISLISGTGSIAWGIGPDGVEARAGGWGYLLGDEGSGYWVTCAAVRHALAALDRGSPPDRLTEQLVTCCGLERADELLGAFYAFPDRRQWADRARLVFRLAEEGDGPSQQIVGEAARALADLAVVVAGRMGLKGPVVMAGGLMANQPKLQAQVRALLAERSITDVRLLEGEPVAGAVRLAEELLA